ALRERAGLVGGLGWSGTFHAIGARLLREFAPAIGLDHAYTIHDREDSADLINVLRRLFAAYVEAKQRQSVLDYDDLLLYWSHMMAEPSIAEEIGARFDHVLV